MQSRCGGLDSRIDNGDFFIKKFGLQFKVRWVVVALNGLQHISHWNKQFYDGKNTSYDPKNTFHTGKSKFYDPKNTFHTGTNKFYDRKKHIL
jgi:hypothetical protein